MRCKAATVPATVFGTKQQKATSREGAGFGNSKSQYTPSAQNNPVSEEDHKEMLMAKTMIFRPQGVLVLFFLFLLSPLSIFSEVQVLVTASRLEEESLQVPLNTTVLEKEDLQGKTVEEILSLVPGLRLDGYTGSPSQRSLAARGFSENAFGRLVVLVDGERLGGPEMSPPDLSGINTADLERVEVILGAPSSAYGSGAVAGVVHFITKKTGTKPTVQAQAGVDGFLGNRQSLGFTLPLGDFFLKASGFREDFRSRRSRSDSLSQGASASVSWKFLPEWNLGFQGEGLSSQAQLPGSLTQGAYQSNPDQAVNQKDDTGSSTLVFGSSLNGQGDWGTLQVPGSFRTVWRTSDTVSFGSYTSTQLQSLQSAPVMSFALSLGSQGILTLKPQGEFLRQSLELKRYGEISRSALLATYNLTRSTLGPALLADLQWGENLVLSAGLRYDQSTLEVTSNPDTVKDSKTDQAWLGQSGLNYTAGPLRVYGHWARTYRLPFLEEQVSYYGFGDTFNKNLGPEWGHSFDLGTEVRLEGLSAGAKAYLLLMEDEIQSDPVTWVNVNIGRTRHTGATLDARWTGSAGPVKLELGGSATYTQAIFLGGTKDGKVLPLVHPWETQASAGLDLPWNLGLQVSHTWLSGAFGGGDNDNTGPLSKDRNLVNLEGRWTWESGEAGTAVLRLKALNLLDDREPLVYYGGYYPREGRSLQAQLGWSWN